MKRNSFKILIILLLFLPAAAALAQVEAEIVYAEGEGFTLVRDGEGEYYDLFVQPAEGMELKGGDIILTERDTWIEIQIGGAQTVVKVAENTTFTLKTLQDEGGTFRVSYGRVRAKVEKLTGETPFWIEGSDTVAGVRGTDFGYDLFYDPASPEKKNVNVYCFDGKVEVVRQLEIPEGEDYKADDLSEGKDYSSTVILRKNEMVSVDSEIKTEGLKKERLDSEVKDFWGENEFIFIPEPPEEELQANFFQVFHNDRQKLRTGSLYSSAIGSFIVGAGAAAYYVADAPGTAIGLTSVGGSLIVAGGYFFIRSLLIPESP